ncbi:hypothetical protein CGGC5_v005571 [Colletotrichum fructicola Nara gc5]|uniref:Uncharacterized protein n=1 Tax=Colletotrichum fructicola (strain Nara gc5) TaxID=1213859 RepID=A0A7J6JCM3_COLFN|nr:hypothetical protein CGGC5_v005571 [Colletotrichum fructicola Nara gc5]
MPTSQAGVLVISWELEAQRLRESVYVQFVMLGITVEGKLQQNPARFRLFTHHSSWKSSGNQLAVFS